MHGARKPPGPIIKKLFILELVNRPVLTEDGERKKERKRERERLNDGNKNGQLRIANATFVS